jgi:hypothetical protein
MRSRVIEGDGGRHGCYGRRRWILVKMRGGWWLMAGCVEVAPRR